MVRRAVVLRADEVRRAEPERAAVLFDRDDAVRERAVVFRAEPLRAAVRLAELRLAALERLVALRVPLLRVRELERELLERAVLGVARRLVVRRRPLVRSLRGISACTTDLVSCGISFSRKPAIRFSSRRIAFASLAVSLSPTASANFWIAV